VKFIALVLLESADVTSVRIVKEQPVRIIDHPRSGEKMTDRNGAAVMGPANPSDDQVIVAHEALPVLG
jgi:hypothetical protein